MGGRGKERWVTPLIIGTAIIGKTPCEPRGTGPHFLAPTSKNLCWKMHRFLSEFAFFSGVISQTQCKTPWHCTYSTTETPHVCPVLNRGLTNPMNYPLIHDSIHDFPGPFVCIFRTFSDYLCPLFIFSELFNWVHIEQVRCSYTFRLL